MVFMDDGVLCEGAHPVLVHAREHAVSLGKARHPRPLGFDDSGKFVSHHDRERIVTDNLQGAGARLEIDGVKTGCLNSDKEFTKSGRRLWHVH
jgi:hypothetical protein